MKLIKSPIFVLLTSLLVVNSLYANPKKTPVEVENKELKLFNESFKIVNSGREISQDKNKKPLIVVKYSIENKSKDQIKAVTWDGVYVYEAEKTGKKEILHRQTIPLTFDIPLNAGEKVDFDVQIPVNKLSPQSQTIFTNPNMKIITYSIAKSLTFVNGKHINVKD